MKTSFFPSPLLAAFAMLTAGCAGPEVNVRVWPTADASGSTVPAGKFAYPEWEGRQRPPSTVGLAFSGGGTVAGTMSVGALRGLKHLGLLERVDYFSGISGGTWGTLPYVFLDATEANKTGALAGRNLTQAQLDDLYLGAYKHPGQLQQADLKYSEPGSETHLVGNTHFRMPFLDLHGDENWSHQLTQTFLEPLGLGDEHRFVCQDEAQLRDILKENPNLKREDFYVAGKGKPFLIAGSAFERPRRVTFFDKLLAAVTPGPSGSISSKGYFPAEMTPLYSGMYQVNAHDPSVTWFPEPTVGGGFVETVGFDAQFRAWQKPGRLATVSHPKDGIFRGQAFGPGDMMAASGAAPAAAWGAFFDAFGFRPEYRAWNVWEQAPDRHASEQGFVDGGACDNTGVASLLAHGVTNIVAFLNSPPYDLDPKEYKGVFAWFKREKNAGGTVQAHHNTDGSFWKTGSGGYAWRRGLANFCIGQSRCQQGSR